MSKQREETSASRTAEEIARKMVVDGTWTSGEPSGSPDWIVSEDGDTFPLDRRFVPGAMEKGAFCEPASGPFRIIVERGTAQSRDLAGRIRALVQEYAGRWADTETADTTVRSTLMDIMQVMRLALFDARSGVIPARRVNYMREHMWIPGRTLVEQAADELDAIARECAQEKKR